MMNTIAERIHYLLWKYEQQYQQTDLDDFFPTVAEGNLQASAWLVAEKQLENPQIHTLSTPSVHHL